MDASARSLIVRSSSVVLPAPGELIRLTRDPPPGQPRPIALGQRVVLGQDRRLEIERVGVRGPVVVAVLIVVIVIVVVRVVVVSVVGVDRAVLVDVQERSRLTVHPHVGLAASTGCAHLRPPPLR